jgi:hypothetical protein
MTIRTIYYIETTDKNGKNWSLCGLGPFYSLANAEDCINEQNADRADSKKRFRIKEAREYEVISREDLDCA